MHIVYRHVLFHRTQWPNRCRIAGGATRGSIHPWLAGGGEQEAVTAPHITVVRGAGATVLLKLCRNPVCPTIT